MPDRLGPLWQQIGFGFDSKTRDYKVVRRRGLDHVAMTDIYSLRKDSWREHSCIPFDNKNKRCRLYPTQNVARSRNSGLRRVYWYSDNCIVSFDMVDEVFDHVSHKRFPKKLKRSMSEGDKMDMHMQTTSKEFMMSAVFGNARVSDIRTSLGPQGAGGGGCYMFVKIRDGKMLAYDPETEKVKKDILGFRAVPKCWCGGFRTPNWKPMAYSYVSSQVSISSLTEHT
ncbi:hypothetical protein LINGRAHAP2_LOCUS36425 [Linum grandiflorum]